MGAQQRVRHSRREFKRAFPQVAEAVKDYNIKSAAKMVRAVRIRNALIALVAIGAIVWRCAL